MIKRKPGGDGRADWARREGLWGRPRVRKSPEGKNGRVARRTATTRTTSEEKVITKGKGSR